MRFDDSHAVPARKLQGRAERRAELRIDVLGQIEAHSVWKLRPLHLREMSEAGFSLEATGPFEPDVAHKFRIGMDGYGRSVVVQAKARHGALASTAGSLPIYVTGFELVSPSAKTLREIRSLLDFAESMWEE